ncbi:MAG TPA: sigma-70 family RNA polymerase sigma factor [Terriglobales bacterium]|nr:sigma-70 family RNA polymerase sigma factor [Terriglobales bacterium]
MKGSGLLPDARYSALKNLSDEVLMAFLAQGNHDALAVLFDRYQLIVMRVAMQVLRNQHEAEDLLQSVFLGLMHTANKFDAAKGSAKAWILQLVYHRGFDRRRYLNCRGVYDAVEIDESITLPHNELVDNRQISMLDSSRIVQEALAHLTDLQRKTIEMAFFEGLTMHEIAAKTGESYAAVRHHYYRGLEKMRRVLGAQGNREQEEEEGGEMAYARS